ncbi:hypothetical protein SBV1_150011 [Verrucomicrobia bacterium]|nr:hypothetical protein SBV1_150011 [Verrucomicrobiota bacterium]
MVDVVFLTSPKIKMRHGSCRLSNSEQVSIYLVWLHDIKGCQRKCKPLGGQVIHNFVHILVTV